MYLKLQLLPATSVSCPVTLCSIEGTVHIYAPVGRSSLSFPSLSFSPFPLRGLRERCKLGSWSGRSTTSKRLVHFDAETACSLSDLHNDIFYMFYFIDCIITCINVESDAERQNLAHSAVGNKNSSTLKACGASPHVFLAVGAIASIAP